MRVAIGSDHAGFELKEAVKTFDDRLERCGPHPRRAARAGCDKELPGVAWLAQERR
jgi:hypothetical protein